MNRGIETLLLVDALTVVKSITCGAPTAKKASQQTNEPLSTLRLQGKSHYVRLIPTRQLGDATLRKNQRTHHHHKSAAFDFCPPHFRGKSTAGSRADGSRRKLNGAPEHAVALSIIRIRTYAPIGSNYFHWHAQVTLKDSSLPEMQQQELPNSLKRNLQDLKRLQIQQPSQPQWPE